MPIELPVLELGPEPLPSEDCTIYRPARPDGEIETLRRQLSPTQQALAEYSFECAVQAHIEGSDSFRARILACRCFRSAWWSITIRASGTPPVVQRREERSEHSTFEQKAEKNPDPQYFAALRDTCGILDAEIFPEPQRRGLVVITGATASGKSKIARGLIYLRMMAAIRDPDREPRKPHLITFEDPIEKFWVSNNDDAQPLNFDYTPREKNIDASDLRSVLKDALRQTPTLIFVGEIRDRREWATVVEFASTGHSLIATAHAGSLAEAWGKILGAVGTSSPSQRSDIADRTLGIVHLRPFPSTGFKPKFLRLRQGSLGKSRA